MRIDQLDLVRYGKFTDRAIALPRAERDFHVIVGPNEAGKSTVRSAVLDLLYGIPARTTHAFAHAMSDMRLGARIEHEARSLAFHRTKGNKQTLRSPANAVLADNVLAPFLGSTDRDFFAQMFGLDHGRLIKGGHDILSASNDLGQILFQSAAGIGSLGAVREALEAEADKLWAKRKSNDRAYYIAADALDRATAALKSATVRTKDWAEAQAKVSELDGAHEETRRQHAQIRSRRNQVERVRRVTPHLNALTSATTRLAELGPVVDLPDAAARTLAEAERVMHVAQAEIDHQTGVLNEAQAALDAVRVDHRIRELATEITELDDQRLQYRAYPGDIARREAEMDAQWRIAADLAAGLGWDAAGAETLRAAIPLASVRVSLRRLIRAHAGLRQSRDVAARAEKLKRAELAQAQAVLAGLASAEAAPGLQAALAQSQKLGDFAAVERERELAVRKGEQALADASAALGAWRVEIGPLRAMAVPAADTVRALAQEQLADDAQARAVDTRLQALTRQLDAAQLEVTHYRQAHEPVTRDAVVSARRLREGAWSEIKIRPQELAQRAEGFERLVESSDALADRRHDTVQQAEALIAKQAQVERLAQELASVQAEADALAAAREARARRWSDLTAACGLPSQPPLPFDAAGPWLEARSATLAAWDRLDDARSALHAHQAACAAATQALAQELAALGQPGNGARLAVQMIQAETHLKAADEMRGQRRTLQQQMTEAEGAIARLSDDAVQAATALDQWQQAWTETLTQAGLARHADPQAADAALDTAEQIDAALVAMQRIRTERIDKMHADLDLHAQAARALAERVAPDLASAPAADITLVLRARLDAANEAHQEAARQKSAIEAAQRKLGESTARRNQAQAALTPLLARAACATNAELADAIDRSDRRRALSIEIASAQKAAESGADGLTLAQLSAEAAGAVVDALIAELADLKAQDEALVNRLTELAATRLAAATALGAICGSAAAAQAEAQRQEALAQMADAVERYIKVHTAARLLKWSIERYRDAKQGPMLSAASALFARLTLGSFERLSVDFEREPLKLQGRRPDGAMVDIDGMSEGTRDQLYLALRLAALEMHLGQAHVLPFIADDLFINYDDRRSRAGLEALGALSRQTQVLFLTHHDHLLPMIREVFGGEVNVVELG
jgi:uncharacterized protein YhaN